MKKAFLNWSSGKDAAFALYLLQQQKLYNISKLVTTVNSEVDRISMHGLRRQLLLQQAYSLGIPLHIISLDGHVSMKSYNSIMESEISRLREEGFTHSIFGDIFLEDLKVYREQQFQKVKIIPVFPLWKMNTKMLIEDFLAAGFKAITVSVNARLLDRSFCGRKIDNQFIQDLPQEVDPAGENGEFHTFVYDGPNFSKPVSFQKGEIVERFFKAKEEDENCFKKDQENWDTKFYYCDLVPVKE